ncbi:DUF4845 domain-containing protein [Marinobacter mobilis]|uniref:DUF4845 domain-containing protein n=1 Tax=Marinobacter mobilis TaxID=488533 RepID=A0A1H3A3Q3_9GAMM|nr:DUF4845 domain-containing protein [Marinobacter mobilis]SDX23844.1 protein of unknown function [Marinobacter mobilis]
MTRDGLSSIRKHRGASTITMLVMVLFFGGLLTMAIKLGPIYLDDVTIQEAIESLDGSEGLSEMGPARVMDLINRRLSVNNVRGFNPQNIAVEKNGEFVIIKVDYEIRTEMFYNVDAVVYFSHEYEMKGK